MADADTTNMDTTTNMGTTDDVWEGLTRRSLSELEAQGEQYRPTNFWGPGLEELLANMRERGLDGFKRWPASAFWFYPTYGDKYTYAIMDKALEAARELRPEASREFMRAALGGNFQAHRDYDVARIWWNQANWPFDLTGFGESRVGQPPQAYPVAPGYDMTVGRAYNNYQLLLAALSQHVSQAPKSFLEIGGGFGVLGEILQQRDPETRYLDVDIPPLLTVASYYLTTLFGRDRFTIYDEYVAASGPIDVPHSGVLPNFRLPDITSTYEVFVNSFSFQEMEPDVVDNYIGLVCDKGIEYAVSLNSRDGKQKASAAGEHGALDPVKADDIADMFAARGLEVVGSYDAPVTRSAGRLLVMKRQ